jgi:hypothetical protein
MIAAFEIARFFALRDQLVAELKDFKSADEAANWAHRVLGAKNSLIAADADCIEETFRTKLPTFAIPQADSRPRRKRNFLGHNDLRVAAKSGADLESSTRACWRYPNLADRRMSITCVLRKTGC